MSKAITKAVFILGLAAALGLIGAEVASAACSTTASALFGPTCAQPGFNVQATIFTAPCTSVPSSVNAQVYDNANNLVETFALAYNAGTGAWTGIGACINPNLAYLVRFVPTGGDVEDTTGAAIGVNCGGC